MFNQKEINQILNISKKAGDIILDYYNDYKSLYVSHKTDNSPVTKADLAANSFIIKELTNFFPNLAIVSEENSCSCLLPK